MDTCSAHAEAGRAELKALANTLSYAGAQEDQQAKSLALFRRKHELVAEQDPGMESTVRNGLTAFGVVFLDNLLKSKVILAHEYTILGDKLSLSCKEQRAIHKRMVAETQRLDKQLQAQQYILQRSRSKYEKAHREAERLLELRNKASAEDKPAEAAKAGARAQVAVYASLEAEELHRQVVDETRRVQIEHSAARRKLAREYQALSEARSAKAKSTLERLASVHLQQNEYVSTLLADLRTMSVRISASKDALAFVSLHEGAAGGQQGESEALAEFEPIVSDLLGGSGVGGDDCPEANPTTNLFGDVSTGATAA